MENSRKFQREKFLKASKIKIFSWPSRQFSQLQDLGSNAE
jgi:hypothetical protein